jgi:hypothetical protein
MWGDAITDVLFVVNSPDEVADRGRMAQALVEASEGAQRTCRVLIRPNDGYSYGAWNAGVMELVHESHSHYFLIEDDYVPRGPGFLDPFLGRMTNDVGFVCQRFERAPGVLPPHAAVSNGLLLGDAARLVHRRFGTIFSIYDLPLGARDWSMGCENQVTFLALIHDAGFAADDIADECSIPFSSPEGDGGSIIERGTPGAYAPLLPIEAL